MVPGNLVGQVHLAVDRLVSWRLCPNVPFAEWLAIHHRHTRRRIPRAHRDALGSKLFDASEIGGS